MKIPPFLILNAHLYRIVEDDLDGDSGDCDNVKCVIRIEKKQKNRQKWATLFHEILHALNIQLSHERCEWIAQGITQVLFDNRLLRQKKVSVFRKKRRKT